MWNARRSLILSKIFVVLFIIALIGVLIFAPVLVQWLIRGSFHAQTEQFSLFLVTLYSGGGVAGILLGCLYRLLHNIGKEQVFIDQNVFLLRIISWGCFIGGLIALVSALYYLPWFYVALAAVFMGLVVRIIKNIMAQAIHLKEENDFTV